MIISNRTTHFQPSYAWGNLCSGSYTSHCCTILTITRHKGQIFCQPQYVYYFTDNITSKPYSFFIGLTRINPGSSVFVWWDGSTITTQHQQWANGEPNNNNGNNKKCVQMGGRDVSDHQDYMWKDYECSLNGRIICQRGKYLYMSCHKPKYGIFCYSRYRYKLFLCKKIKN